MYSPKHSADKGFSFPMQIILLKLNGFWPVSRREEGEAFKTGFYNNAMKFFYKTHGWLVIIDILFIMYWEAKFLVTVFGNLMLLTENLCSSFMGFLMMSRMLHLKMTERQFHKMIRLFIKDIWIPKNSHPVIERECEEKMKPYRVMTLLMVSLAIMYGLVPFVQVLHLGWESPEKPFPFRMLFDFDSQQRVPYVVIFLMSFYAGITVVTTLSGEDSLIGFFFTYTCGQYQILHNRIDNIRGSAMQRVGLQNGLYDRRQLQREYLREINSIAYKQNILMQFVKVLEESFNVVVLVNFALSTFLLCLVGFQLSTGKNMILGDYVKFGIFILSTVAQLFLICWNGDRLIQMSTLTADHLYACKWEGDFIDEPGARDRHSLLPAAKQFRQHLQIMIMCSQRPIFVTAGKFAPMSLQTFTRLLSSAVSYFTLLQTMYKRES